MTSNNLWTFGDSFTEGVFEGQIDKLLEVYGYLPINWTSILASKLDLNLHNISKGGISNHEILSNILQHLPEIKKGDVVVISDTIPIRTFGYNHIQNKMTSFNNEIFVMEGGDDELIDSFNIGDKKILLDYILNFIVKYEMKWIEYWELELKKIIDICLSNGVECYYWSHRYWKKFSSLSLETKNIILDDHWGARGNKEFAEYLHKRILKKDYYDTLIPNNII